MRLTRGLPLRAWQCVAHRALPSHSFPLGQLRGLAPRLRPARWRGALRSHRSLYFLSSLLSRLRAERLPCRVSNSSAFLTRVFPISLWAIFSPARRNKTMHRVAVLVLPMTLFFGLIDWAIAGPFGLSMGMQPSEVG